MLKGKEKGIEKPIKPTEEVHYIVNLNSRKPSQRKASSSILAIGRLSLYSLSSPSPLL